MKTNLFLIPIFFVISCTQNREHNDFLATTRPSFKVNYNMPTADKPQSKLWFMNNSWWTLLPDSSGPSLWQRTEMGWKEHPEIKSALKNVPGRADVWPEEKKVTAVGVGDSSLTVFRVIFESGSPSVNYISEVLSQLFPPNPASIETATIAKDGKGTWWIAATAEKKVCVWSSTSDGKSWSEPFVLAQGLDKDDICTITLIHGGVGVIWSDQIRDAVLMKVHKDEDPRGIWGKEEVADSGNKTADDHLNTVLTSDGTLWLTSKNSVDQAGKPQFVLRIRTVDGNWKNMPYLVLENRMKRPSRPIVLATDDDSYVFVGHGDNDRSFPYPHNSEIEFACIPADSISLERLNNPHPVIVPDSTYKYMIQNVTGPKKPFPKNAPWIILASDSKGNVYEADLKNLVKPKGKEAPKK